MKHKIILKQQVKYAPMIETALSLCEIMLSRSETLYPFAVISEDGNAHCIFLNDDDYDSRHPNDAHFSMIEKLEQQLAVYKMRTHSTTGMLVYAATIRTPLREEKDGIMFSICDADGANILTLYPYEFEENSIKIGKPFTCDFSD